MTKYFLIVLEPGLSIDQIQNVVTQIEEIRQSQSIKYRMINGSFIIHFGTTFNHNYAKEFVDSVMTECQYSYILCENTDKVTLNLLSNNKEQQKSLMEDFLCLETGSAILEINKDYYDPLLEELLDYVESEFDEDDGYYDYLKPKFVEEYSLDEILDKIGEFGLDSLTENEKNFLQKIK